MKAPIVTWYIKNKDSFVQEDDFYYGSINSDETINLNIQVWNNRYGTTEVDTITDAKIILYFENFEDNMLLNYCNVKVGETSADTTKELDRLIIPIGSLSGDVNNGINSEINRDNFKDIEITFKSFPQNLKKGLKSIYLDVKID